MPEMRWQGGVPFRVLAIVVPIPEIQPLDDTFHLFEGPLWIGDTLYFSDIAPAGWSSSLRTFVPATRAVGEFLPDTGSNGLAIAADGTLYSATSGRQEISRYTPGNSRSGDLSRSSGVVRPQPTTLTASKPIRRASTTLTRTAHRAKSEARACGYP